jgi:dolichol-phosphate mannosyltransferase
MKNNIDLSVVLPVYNEAGNLEPLVEELTGILKGLNKSWEIICINDASTDDSLGILNRLKPSCPELRILNHTINSGESAGQATGFGWAKGDIIITMDADMQNDPADIPKLINALARDVACVCGVRNVREDNAVRRLSSYVANKFRNLLTGDAVSDAGCTFRVIRRSALNEMIVFNGMHRFLPTILRAQACHVVEVSINHRARFAGESKYGIGNRLWRGIVDCFAIRWYKTRALQGNRVEEKVD